MMSLSWSVLILTCFLVGTNGFAPGFQHCSKPTTFRSGITTVTALFGQPKEQADKDPSTSRKRLIVTPISKLDEALLTFNSTAIQEIMSDINELRDRDPALIATFLEQLLKNGPDKNLPSWAKTRRLPLLARVSKRARLGSLRRLLDMSSPISYEEETTLQSRRRTLFAVLRELQESNFESRSKAPAIVILEKKARREAKSGPRTENLRDRLPPGLETPEYSVVMDAGSYEIRDYKPFSVCAVSRAKPRPVGSSKTDETLSMPEMKGASAFGALAGYLFGKNQQSEAMKMTTPVISSGAGDAEEMAFVLPSTYWKEGGIESAPQPFPESGVNLKFDKGGHRAVMMFGGIATKKEIEARSNHLLTDLAKNTDWQAEDEPVSILAYNDPFTPPWKRLNEVSIGVSQRQ